MARRDSVIWNCIKSLLMIYFRVRDSAQLSDIPNSFILKTNCWAWDTQKGINKKYIQSSHFYPDSVYPDIHNPDGKLREQTCISNIKEQNCFDNPNLAFRHRTENGVEIRINKSHIPSVLHVLYFLHVWIKPY